MTDPDFQPDLPTPLREALRTMDRSTAVPPELDRRILADAKAGFARRQRFRRVMPWGISAAVAASVALMVWMQTFDPASTTTPASPVIAGDIDGSGRVDILDAFVVARQLDRREAASPQWDMNGDGQVDAADVEQIASAAVRLPEGRTIQ